MPFLKRMLRHGYRLEPMTVGLPTSTPAFQMAAMYGVRPDIPGFHYFDRERQADIHFPRPGHAALVEARQAAGRRGIVQGGSTYGCVFTGGAENNLFSFASLTRPSGRGLLQALSPVVLVSWVCLKNLARTIVELGRAVARLVAHPVAARRGWRWTTIKIGFSVWVRGFFTLAVVARPLRRHPGRVRELPRLRRRGTRLRSPQPAGALVAAPRGPRDPPALARGPPRARAPIRSLRPRRPRPSSLPALPRAQRGPSVRAVDLRAVLGARAGRRGRPDRTLGPGARDPHPPPRGARRSSSASSTISRRISSARAGRRRTSRTASG